MRVAILGAGRLGRSLGILLPRAGVDAVVWRRAEPFPQADILWICVSDAAIGPLAATLPRGPVVLHASGAVGPEVLAAHARHGVLHPLMTFPGPENGLPDLHGAGAGVAGPASEIAADLARRLGMVPFALPRDQHAYHAAATMASGHLAAAFLEAADVLARTGVPDAADRLLPLALESLRRVAGQGARAITGPAARGDQATVAAHRGALDPHHRALYDLLTTLIVTRLLSEEPHDSDREE